MKKIDILVIGAGPVGLFTVFEAGLLGLKCILIDNLDKPGGQCAELYPEKPIYDIPGVPFQTAQEHVDALIEQIKPFDYDIYLNERVDSIQEVNHEEEKYWEVTTTEDNKFLSKNIFIAAGAGSAFLGLFIMFSQVIAGNEIQQNNLLIQIGASILFPTLFYFERDKN